MYKSATEMSELSIFVSACMQKEMLQRIEHYDVRKSSLAHMLVNKYTKYYVGVATEHAR